FGRRRRVNGLHILGDRITTRIATVTRTAQIYDVRILRTVGKLNQPDAAGNRASVQLKVFNFVAHRGPVERTLSATLLQESPIHRYADSRPGVEGPGHAVRQPVDVTACAADPSGIRHTALYRVHRAVGVVDARINGTHRSIEEFFA